MFGYDFMIDDKFGVWLIEVNSSPAMDYSTVNNNLFNVKKKHVTEKIVKEGSGDLAKVIVDYNMASKSQRSQIDTGKFICLYKGKSTVEKPNSLGLNLMVEGK
jgi:tubulin monoglycylase TTLL3/8